MIVLILFIHFADSYALNHKTLQFPGDHGSHQEANVEWWNFFGHLEDSDKHTFGFSLTFLRLGLPAEPTSSQWATQAIYMSHFTIMSSKKKEFFEEEKNNRTSFNYAGASQNQLLVWNRLWSAEMDSDIINLQAQTKKAALSLHLTPTKPILLYGRNGLLPSSSAGENNAYYYSYPRLQGNGSLIFEGKEYKIVDASAIMDHEFQSVKQYNSSWDKFIIQLDNNEEIILYIFAEKQGNFVNPDSFGVINRADGEHIELKLADFQLTPIKSWHSSTSNMTYPVSWTLIIPKYNYRLNMHPGVENQEIISLISTYWQGEAAVSGVGNGVQLSGYAYFELSSQQNRSYILSRPV